MIRILLIVSSLFPAVVHAADFRGSTWGDTPSQVKAEQGQPVEESPNMLVYTAKLAGEEVKIAYKFQKGKLNEGTYRVVESHSDRNAYLDAFERFKKLLTEKYGQPTDESTTWSGDLYRYRPDRHGFAISIGDLAKSASWKTDRTEINMTITGDNYKVNLLVQYEELTSQSEVEEDKRKEQLEGF